MPEKQIELTGKTGLFALVLILGFVGFKLLSFDRNTDPELRDAVMVQLRNELGASANFEKNYLNEAEDYEESDEGSDPFGISIYSIYVSKPLLNYSSNQKAIVKVHFSLPGKSREVAYYQFRDSLIGGWSYDYPSTAYAYYSNFY